MTERPGLAPAESLDWQTSIFLRAVAFAMANGVALPVAVSLFFYARASGAPAAGAVRLVNGTTIAAMGASFGAIVLSELLWKKLLAAVSASDVNAKVRTAFIARAALREGAALAGVLAFFLACREGVLRAYPAYWVDLAPAALFWSFLYAHWPTLDSLRAEVAQARGEGRMALAPPSL